MSFRFSLLLPAFGLLALGADASFAHTAMPGVDQRVIHQQQRIGHGVTSGQLTPSEARGLAHGQQHISHMASMARADGIVTAKERSHMHRALAVQSRHIHGQKHDRQHMPR